MQSVLLHLSHSTVPVGSKPLRHKRGTRSRTAYRVNRTLSTTRTCCLSIASLCVRASLVSDARHIHLRHRHKEATGPRKNLQFRQGDNPRIRRGHKMALRVLVCPVHCFDIILSARTSPSSNRLLLGQSSLHISAPNLSPAPA